MRWDSVLIDEKKSPFFLRGYFNPSKINIICYFIHALKMYYSSRYQTIEHRAIACNSSLYWRELWKFVISDGQYIAQNKWGQLYAELLCIFLHKFWRGISIMKKLTPGLLAPWVMNFIQAKTHLKSRKKKTYQKFLLKISLWQLGQKYFEVLFLLSFEKIQTKGLTQFPFKIILLS